MEDDHRVILHFDMDCFYAQVEMIRNPVLRSKPVGENFTDVSLRNSVCGLRHSRCVLVCDLRVLLPVSGVQQKYLMVTCNYLARERGVAKMMSVKDALEKCPDLVLVKGEDLTFYREISYKVTGNTHTHTDELIYSYMRRLIDRGPIGTGGTDMFM